jgi:NitT/TauT family transport system substrate-binding protein
MDDLRIIADGNQGGVAGYASVEYYVRNGSPIRTIEDLRGKVLASNAFGGAADFGLRAVLLRHGLRDSRDYVLIEAPFPTLGKLLLDDKVDLIAMTAPYRFDPTFAANAHILFRLQDGLGPTQQLVTAARRGFLETNRAAVTDFFEDYLIALRWFLDPANRSEAIAILARFTHLPEQQFAGWAFDQEDFYHDPAARPNMLALTQNLAALNELGFLPVALDPKPYVDLSFIEEAARRLK